MTNMIPQAPTNNQQTWNNFESYLRSLVQQGNEIYVVMGSYGTGGTGSSGYQTTIDGGHVTVPARIWKVAVVLSNGDGDLGRITTSTRVIAIDTPNTNSVDSKWQTYLTSVDALEVVLKDFKPRLKLAKKLKGAQESLKRAQSEFDLTARRALSSDQITEGQVKKYIAEAQRKVDVRKEELQVLKDEASSELFAKDALKPDFRSFYGSMTRPERKEFLSIFVRRIDVGDTFLTAHWWFSDGMTRISRDEVMSKKGRKFENAVVVLSNGLAGDPDVAGSSVAGVSTRGQIYQDRGSSTTVDKRAHSGPSLSFDAGCEVGKTMVEIGANRQSCDPSIMLLFKLVLDVVLRTLRGAS